MIIPKSIKYYQNKVRIDKANHTKTASKIQFYNDKLVDNLVENYHKAGEVNRPVSATIQAELAILNKPEVYSYYNRIMNSKYVNHDAVTQMLIKNNANKELQKIAISELERINKNLDYVEEVMNRYDVPLNEYQKMVKKQEKESVANLTRKQILDKVAIKANDLLVSEGLNIPPNVFSYRQIETTAQALLRQSQMGAKFEEVNRINDYAVDNGKHPIYTHKRWINTGGKNTRHRHNHGQTVEIDKKFIVMHDKTLHIDRMMYPCDPAGSFQNAWICYCEVDYTDKDGNIYRDTLGLNQTHYEVNSKGLINVSKPQTPLPSVSFGKTIVDLNEPAKQIIAQPVGLNITNQMKTNNIVTGTPTQAHIDVDIDGVTSIPHNYLIDSSKVNVVYDNGKYYYNGLELSEFDYDNGLGKVSKKAVTKHNNNLIVEPVTDTAVKSELITQSDLNQAYYSELNETYTIFDFMGVDEVNGKYYYKGLDITDYWDSESKWADVPKKVIETYNQNEPLVNNDVLTTVENQPLTDEINIEKEIIDINNLDFEDGKYLVSKDYLVINETTGKAYFKGLEVKDYNKEYDIGTINLEDVIEHNHKLGDETVYSKNTNGKIVKGEPIDTGILDDTVYSDGSFDIDPIKYPELKPDIKYNDVTGNWEYKGLKIKGNFEEKGYGWIEPKDVIEHNKQFGEVETTVVESTKPTTIQKELITNMDATYSSEDGGYLVETFKIKEINGKYYFKGLEVETVNTDNFYTLIPKEKVEQHNQTVKSIGELHYIDSKVHGSSNILKMAEDNDGDKFAVDEDGRKWVLDEKSKYEKHQDDLQNQVDMSAEYRAVESWGGSGYREINHFNYLKRTFGDSKYVELHKEIVPLLDEHRNAVFEGKSTEKISKNINNVIEKYKNKDEFNQFDRVFKVIDKIKDIDSAMAKAPSLQQDTCFLRAGAWKLDFNKIGEIFEWEGFAGVTYRNRPVDLGHESLSYNITILAPRGTKGVRMSKQFDAITTEREWLLPRGQKFKVLEFDKVNHTCTIELINEGF